MNNIKKLQVIAIVVILTCTALSQANAEDKKCFHEVIIKNVTGHLGFGAIWNYPGDIEPSVWFPIVPRALAIDSRDNVYVGDSVNYRVLKFDNSGKFLLEFKLQPPLKKIKPEISHIIRSLGIDKDDNVFVWNYLEDRVEIYNQNGKFKESIDSHDDKQKGVFAPIPKGKAANYIYDINSYIPDKKHPGNILYAVTVRDRNKLAAQCNGVEIAYDDNGEIYSFDKNGNLYTFDHNLNVVRINPFK